MLKNVAPDWLAMAFPISVFPVPGGPNSSSPVQQQRHNQCDLTSSVEINRTTTVHSAQGSPFGSARSPVKMSGRAIGQITSSFTHFFANRRPATGSSSITQASTSISSARVTASATLVKAVIPISSNVIGSPLSTISISIFAMSSGSQLLRRGSMSSSGSAGGAGLLFPSTKNTFDQLSDYHPQAVRQMITNLAPRACFSLPFLSPVGSTNGLFTAGLDGMSPSLEFPPNKRFWLIGW